MIVNDFGEGAIWKLGVDVYFDRIKHTSAKPLPESWDNENWNNLILRIYKAIFCLINEGRREVEQSQAFHAVFMIA